MSRARLLADMNVSPQTVGILRDAGYDIVRVSDRISSRSSDLEILHLAEREERTLVSHDHDFSALLAIRGRTRPSLVTLRLDSADPLETARRLIAVLPGLADSLRRGAAVTVDEVRVRVRLLPVD